MKKRRQPKKSWPELHLELMAENRAKLLEAASRPPGSRPQPITEESRK